MIKKIDYNLNDLEEILYNINDLEVFLLIEPSINNKQIFIYESFNYQSIHKITISYESSVYYSEIYIYNKNRDIEKIFITEALLDYDEKSIKLDIAKDSFNNDYVPLKLNNYFTKEMLLRITLENYGMIYVEIYVN